MNNRITNIVNLTPYVLEFIDDDGDGLVNIKPSGTTVNLPEPREGTIYIVYSALVTERIPDRKDVFIPNPNKSVRDEHRMRIRCRSIKRI